MPAVVGALVGGLLFLAAHRALLDDAYITLSYARNLAEHGEWALAAGYPANTQTSPVNALALAGLIALTGAPVVSVGLLLVLALALVGWWTAGIAARAGVPPVPAGVFLVVLLATSPALAATVGLETFLTAAALVAVARYALDRGTVATGIATGVAVLVRPDLAVPATVVALGVLGLRRTSWSKLAGVVGVLTAVVLLWHLPAWRWLGGFLPDTFALKTQPTRMSMLTAPVEVYGRAFPLEVALTAVVVLAGTASAVIALRTGRPDVHVAVPLVAAGWAHGAALWAVGAFPQLWYYTPLVVTTSAALVLGLARLGRGAWAAVTTAAVCGALLCGPPPWQRPPMMVNFGTAAEYAAIGGSLGRLTGGEPVGGPYEIGTLAYFSPVPVLDFFSDRSQTRVYLDRRQDAAGPVGRLLLAWNWRYRPEPPPSDLRWRLAFERIGVPPGRIVSAWPLESTSRGPDRVLLVDTAPVSVASIRSGSTG